MHAFDHHWSKLAVAASALTLAGCMIPPLEAGTPLAVDYHAQKTDAVPPLPDYRSEYRPAAGTGWTSGWDRTSPQRTETARDYYLIDAADGLAQAIGDAPPDFAFRFDGRDAWIWVSNEGEAMIVEPSPYGVIQYYYAPRAAAPYLVRDVYQSYAYEGPDFVASYGQDGRLDQRVPSPRTLDSADRLQARGRAIMAASYQRRWDDGVAASWSVQTFSGFGFGDNYGGGIGRGWSGGWQPRWREHRDWELERELRRERDARRRLEQEARDRADNADRFRQWRREGRRGTAPTMRRGGRGGNPGGDSFVPPVRPPEVRPAPGAGPIMTPGGAGNTGRTRPGPDRPRPGMVAPVIAQPEAPTVQPTPVPAGPEVPRVVRRPRPEPGVVTQPSEVSVTPLVTPENDRLLREQRDAEAAARAAQVAIEAERNRERAIHLEAERIAREEEARERAERAAVAAAEQRSREAEQAQAEAQQRAAAQAAAEAQERAEARAEAQRDAAAARAAAAAEAAAQAAADASEERQRARPANAGEDENVRPD